MAELDKNTALIDQYLSGEMTAQEQAAFEQKLENDEQLQQELKLHQEISNGIALEGEELLKAELDGYHEELVSGSTLNKPWVKVGLGLLGLMSVGLLVLVIVNIGKKAEELKAQHSTPVVKDTASTKEVVVTQSDTAEVVVASPQKEPKVEKDQTTLVTKEQILYHYVHDQTTSYTFKGRQLQLYNFDYPLRSVDLRIHDNQLYLFHHNHYYPLKSGVENKPLQKLDDVREFETLKYATGKGPKVTITNESKYVLQEEEAITLIIDPDYEGQAVNLDKAANTLTIGKDLEKEVLKISRYGQGESLYVLQIGEMQYLLKAGVKQVPELLEEEKVFPKDKVTIPVRHETVENSYLLEESN